MHRLHFTGVITAFLTLSVAVLLPVAALSSMVAAPAVAQVPHLAFRDLGSAAKTAPISIVLTLAYHHPEQLEQLIGLQSDPTSPYYRHWLTSEQFNAAFAPSPLEYRRVLRALQRAGFRITQTFSNRTVVDASGAIGTAERYFDTAIHRAYQPGYGIRYANVRPALLPLELRGLVFRVNGLDDLVFVHSDIARASRVGWQGVRLLAAATGQRLYGPVNPENGLQGYAPAAFSTAYNFPNRHKSASGYYDGSGRKSGIVIDADFLDSDLAGYLSYFKIKRTAKAIRVLVDGGPPSGLTYDSGEATLDVEALVGTAPGTTLYIYEFPSFSSASYITDAYNQVVSDNLVDTANSSFGGCEAAESAYAEAWDHIAMQGDTLGITFHASSGDQGSSCGFSSGLGVSAPASSPHFVAVGGTKLTIKKRGGYDSETAWTLFSTGFGASGGGVSSIFPLPAWQKGVKNVLQQGRNIPDVSFDAAPDTGMALYYSGTWYTQEDPVGGTSLSSPLFGAAQTEIDQVTGSRFGLAAKTLFAFWKANGYGHRASTFFHDITTGDNGAYNCLRGYDQVTGIGSMDVWNIAQGLASR